MVAGEASGDLLAGLLLGGLRERWPTLRSAGIGGPRMAEHGFEAWWPHDKLAVRGYVEVLRHYRELSAIRRRLGDRLLSDRPDAFIGVDAPDFNLGLEARLKQQGIKTIHFISPSIWAWRPKRVHQIGKAADHVLCLFPFEPALYEKHGIDASYVGHPLADAIALVPPREASRHTLGLDHADKVVAVLPGSRRSEVEQIAPRLIAAAGLMQQSRPELRFVLPIVPGLREMVAAIKARVAPDLRIDLLNGQSHPAMAASDVVLVASGTATLEAALFKRPMVICYAMNGLSWQIMKRLQLQPWVGLPNILLEDFAVPELLQENATPQRIAATGLQWLDDPLACQRVAQRFEALHLRLRCNMAHEATRVIEHVLAH